MYIQFSRSVNVLSSKVRLFPRTRNLNLAYVRLYGTVITTRIEYK